MPLALGVFGDPLGRRFPSRRLSALSPIIALPLSLSPAEHSLSFFLFLSLSLFCSTSSHTSHMEADVTVREMIVSQISRPYLALLLSGLQVVRLAWSLGSSPSRRLGVCCSLEGKPGTHQSERGLCSGASGGGGPCLQAFNLGQSLRIRRPGIEWKTGRKPKIGKNRPKIGNGPRPETGKKWPTNGKKWKTYPKFHFSAADFGPWTILFFADMFSLLGLRPFSILYQAT